MSEEKKTKVERAVALILGSFLVLAIIFNIGIAMFGHRFEADLTDLIKADKAQADIIKALFLKYHDFARVEVRYDHSAYAYIQKEKYMSVPYPDRHNAFSSVGKVWCENKGIRLWHLPKVVLRDIQTGEELDSYRCISGLISRK